MSEKPITFERDGQTYSLRSLGDVTGAYRRATEADLAAAGWVKASQLADVTAKLEAAEGRVRAAEAERVALLDYIKARSQDWMTNARADITTVTKR